MNDSQTQSKEVALENIISVAVKIPGVKVDRESFLTDLFAKENVSIQDILEHGPIQAGIAQEKISSLANKLILTRTTQSSAASFVSGIPGGLAMAAALPADIMQFFGMALRLAQELSYLYGAENLWKNGTIDEEKVKSQLIMYCGVMFGVSGAVSGVRVLSTQIAKTTLHKLPQKALTKTFWYPIIKQIGKAIGIKVTKTTVAQGVSKAVPIIGGVISGSLNFASMMPMANRLNDVFHEASFHYTTEEFEADIIEIEKISENPEIIEQPSKRSISSIGSTFSQGIKKAGDSLSGAFSKKNNSDIDNLEKIKKLKELLDMGAITQEEFEMKKKDLLN